MAEQLEYNAEQSAELGKAIGVLAEVWNMVSRKETMTEQETELLGGYLGEVLPIIAKYPEIFEHEDKIAELIKIYESEDELSQ